MSGAPELRAWRMVQPRRRPGRRPENAAPAGTDPASGVHAYLVGDAHEPPNMDLGVRYYDRATGRPVDYWAGSDNLFDVMESIDATLAEEIGWCAVLAMGLCGDQPRFLLVGASEETEADALWHLRDGDDWPLLQAGR